MITLSSSGLTHPGLVREANEDTLLLTPRLALVADGLGGHAAGEVASAIAVARMRELERLDPLHPDDVIAAILEANRLVVDGVREDERRAGMGTTLSGLALVELGGAVQCLVLNVGDSRVYRYVLGRFTQVSVDHSEVQELQDAGQLSAQDAANYPRRNIITRCLGTMPAPDPDLWTFLPCARERFLICSDGLTGELGDAVLEQVLAEQADPDEAAAVLMERALDAGGRDNVTVIVADLTVTADAVEQ